MLSIWVMKTAASDPRFAEVVAQWKASGSPIEPQGSARRLGDDIVAVAGVPDADWVVFRSAPAEVLLGGPTAGRRQAIWIGSTVAVAGGLIILLVMLALLRPLRQLELRALRLIDEGAEQPLLRSRIAVVGAQDVQGPLRLNLHVLLGGGVAGARLGVRRRWQTRAGEQRHGGHGGQEIGPGHGHLNDLSCIGAEA